MSTKTLRKRIALVAVSAMGFGLLTSVAAHADEPADATPYATAETLALATTNSTTAITISTSTNLDVFKGKGLISTTDGTTVAASGATGAQAYKTLTGSAVASGVVYSNAQLNFLMNSATGSSIVVSGATISDSTGTDAIGSSLTSAIETNGATTFGVIVKPNVAVGSTFTVSAYAGALITSTATAKSGALVGRWTFTVASASGAGVYSSTYSTVTQQPAITMASAVNGNSNAFDTATLIPNGYAGVIYFSLADTYGAPITTSDLAVTATNGALVNAVTNAANTGSAYAAGSSFDLLSGESSGFIVVTQPVANTAGTSVVSITLDGDLIATKTLNWSGDVATLSFDKGNSATTFRNGIADAAALAANTAFRLNVVYVAKDAAGNVVTLTKQPTVSDASGSMVGATVITEAGLAANQVVQSTSVGYGATSMLIPATTLNGAGKFRLKLVNAAGTSVYSDYVDAKVSNGSTYTFSATWDKSSYAPGEIGTLTISLKDAYGNPMASGTAVTGLVSSVNTAGFTLVGKVCDNTRTVDSAGSVTCKYAAGNDEGSYAYSVAVTSGSLQAPVVGSLPIKATTTVVTNAQVLDAIVKLIASINQQIAALQKALTKKKK